MRADTGTSFVLALDASVASLELVGGKGASLACMATVGLPVPAGFHVTTTAYRRFVAANDMQGKILALVATVREDDPTTAEMASRQITGLFAQELMPEEVTEAIRDAYVTLSQGRQLSVAVRSSATAEDLPEMSFAGQQETYLNMRGETMVLDAVKRCWASLWTARAIMYRARHHIGSEDVSLAVVVQTLVDAQAAGILFTVNPLTGEGDRMVINAAWGLGEAIVGGLVTPDTLVVNRASGKIIEQTITTKDVMTVRTSEGTHEEAVPDELRAQPVLDPTQVADLRDLGQRIEDLYARPMDIEWALQDGRFFIVQARPITALNGHDQQSDPWNDSLIGDYLWTNTNLGEAVPDVMTPCTWSLLRILVAETIPIPSLDGYPIMGNIGGRFYLNFSLIMGLGSIFGVPRKMLLDINEVFFGVFPADLEIPMPRLPRWRLVSKMMPEIIRALRLMSAYNKRLPAFLASVPERCDVLRARIEAVSTDEDLINLWRTDLEPLYRNCLRTLRAAAGRFDRLLARDLLKLVGEADTNVLISGLSNGTAHLASLGPLVGLEQLASGKIDRTTYVRQYGHRGPHELEVSLARPVENPNWVEQQLADLNTASIPVTELLARQQREHEAAWERLRQRYPRQAVALRRRMDRTAAASRNREAARSELVRIFWVLRLFVLRASEITGQGDAIFFLSIDEILAVVGGDTAVLSQIPSRRTAYARYAALSPYPTLIRGHFDPFRWSADAQRRSDVFDASRQTISSAATDVIKGFSGAAGIVEGDVRVITTAEEGAQLRSGEILVTTMTNVGWTPLFPRAAAIVTDVGAPLSHAAIVARELGIPAVVGCGNATMRLRTGDHVRVDGTQGTVEVLM